MVAGDLVGSLRKGAASQAGVERSILEKLLKRYFLSLGRALEEPKTAEPAEQSAGLFWARLLLYQCIVEPGKEQEFTLLIRNNFDEVKEFRAKVLAPEQ